MSDDEPKPEPVRSGNKATIFGVVVAVLGLLSILAKGIFDHWQDFQPWFLRKAISTPAPTSTPIPTPTPTIRQVLPPTPVKVLLRRIDIRATAKDPNKKIPDDVTFSLFKGTKLIDTRTISAANQPWQKPQEFSFKLTPPVQLNDTNSLHMKIEKKARRGHALTLTLITAGQLSDGRTPPLYLTHQFTLGAGDYPDTQPVHEFSFNTLSE